MEFQGANWSRKFIFTRMLAAMNGAAALASPIAIAVLGAAGAATASFGAAAAPGIINMFV